MKLVGGDFGVPQDISPSAGGNKAKALITEAREYLDSLTLILGEGIREICKNDHEHCSFWATLGECEGTLLLWSGAYLSQYICRIPITL